jgi:GTPase SAR1 family protein
LIGNKIDLDDIRNISTDDGREFAKENNMLFIETSALESTNIEESFLLIIKEICDNYKSDSEDEESKQRKINIKKVSNL